MAAERLRVGLALSILVPAALAGTAAHLILQRGAERPAPERLPSLVRVAYLTPAFAIAPEPARLRPVLARRGVAGLRLPSLEPLEGGIRPAPPARVQIPAAGVDADVRPVAARRSGIEVPPVGHAGWFEGGPRPGEPGRAVLLGHLDGRRGPGPFAEVPKLSPGASLSVTDDRGERHAFRIVGSVQVEKSRFPTERVYGHGSRPTLVLVTCGGPYGPAGYRDNVIVYARAA